MLFVDDLDDDSRDNAEDDSEKDEDFNIDKDDIDFQGDPIKINAPQIDDLIDSIMDIISKEKIECDKTKKLRPYVWGFSITVSPDKKPIIREFGNIKSSSKGVSIHEERDPLIEIIDENNELIIIAELPGVTEEQISLECNNDYCKLLVSSVPKYQKIINFPVQVDPNSKIMHYKNGILEIKFKKS